MIPAHGSLSGPMRRGLRRPTCGRTSRPCGLLLDEVTQLRERAPERGLQPLRSETHRELRRAHDVDEEAGDEAAFFAAVHFPPHPARIRTSTHPSSAPRPL